MRTITADNLSEPIMAHVQTDMVMLRQDQTAADALERLRRMSLSDRIVYLYVLDAGEKLVGVVPVRRLLGASPEATMGSLMVSPAVSIPSSSSVLEACEVFLDRRFLALPVVDDEGRPVGVVDLSLFTDTVLTAAQHQRDSAFQLIGVHVALGRQVSPWLSFKDRFPWLLCNMASGILCAFLVSRFELLLSQVVILAMFITVVLALAESVSMQSMTITLQGLVGRGGGWRRISSTARKELFTSALLGAGCGGLMGVTVWLWRSRPLEALAVGGSILLAIITACLLGVAVPTLIRILRIDPKVAAGPIALAATDVATLFYYFNLAQWMLG